MIKITVKEIDGYCNQPMLVGDTFYLKNNQITTPNNKGICMWALQAMMPLLPCLERKKELNEEDWIKKTETVQCPDPRGEVKYSLEVIEDD